MSNLSIIVICGFLVATGFLQAQGWRGIVPLHSTREDVERLIGSPTEPNGITYVLKNERVNIVYSKTGCLKDQPDGWNIPPGTVIGITIYPQVKLMLSDLRVDLNRFEKSINPRNPDSVYYNNNEEGVSIGTRSNGEVMVIQYLPAARDNHLRCPGSSAQQLSGDEKEYLGHKFDEYSNISFRDEKARLDNLAIDLQREQGTKGYIVVYAGRSTSANKARARAKRAKSYLINVRGINKERIVTIFGGLRNQATVELYIVPREAPASPRSHYPAGP